MCSRYATLCNSGRTSTFEYYVSYFEKQAQKKTPAGPRQFPARDRQSFNYFVNSHSWNYEPRIAGADSFTAAPFASDSFAVASFAAASRAAFAAADRAPRPESRLNCRIL